MAASSGHGGSETDTSGGAVVAAVALGSNLGDREAHLTYAVGRLAAFLLDLRFSSFHQTAPEGVDDQPLYLNAAVVGRTELTPRAVLDRLLIVESERGRARPYPGAARTLDLDLVLHGNAVLSEPGLEVPHPRFRERAFVLRPLAEIGRELRDPVSGLTVGELLARLENARGGRRA